MAPARPATKETVEIVAYVFDWNKMRICSPDKIIYFCIAENDLDTGTTKLVF